MLAYPDYDRPFKLYTDASGYAVGGVLSQDDKEGRERVICYIGRSLTAQEKNYGISEKECLALVYSIKKLDCFLRYTSFTAYVDHAALKWLFSLQQPSGKFARWITLLQSYTFEIQYRPGQVHGNADGVSRRVYDEPDPADLALDDYDPIVGLDFDFPTPVESKTVGRVTAISAAKGKQRKPKETPACFQLEAEDGSPDRVLQMSKEDFVKEQQSDPNCAPMVAYLECGELPNESGDATRIVRTADSYFIHDNILYHVHTYPGRGDKTARSTIQLVVPRQLLPRIMRENHDSPLTGGHLGISRTIEKVRSKFFWLGMCQDITNWVKSCEPCNHRKAPPIKTKAQIIPMPIPSMPFERVSTDILGPLPTCKDSGNKYVVVFIDYFSKYVELIAVPDIKAETIARNFVKEIVCRHGAPFYLHSDRGSNYLSNIVKETCRILDIEKTQTTSYHPQCNGQSERCMSYILASLAKRLDAEHDTWDRHLPFVQFVYNTTPCLDSTGYSPAFLVNGRYLRSPLDHSLPTLPEPPRSAQVYVAELLHNLESARVTAREVTRQRKLVMAAKSQPAKAVDFRVGDVVYLHRPVLTNPTQSKKLSSSWHGPFYICEKISPVNVRLRRKADNVLMKGRIHVNRLKRATERMQGLSDPLPSVEPVQEDNSGHDGAQDDVHDVSIKDLPSQAHVDQAGSFSHSDGEGGEITVDSVQPKVDHSRQYDTNVSKDDNRDQPYYEIEKIVGRKFSTATGKWLYRVKWLTFSPRYNSWVSFEDLNPTCQQYVRAAKDKIPIMKSRRK